MLKAIRVQSNGKRKEKKRKEKKRKKENGKALLGKKNSHVLVLLKQWVIATSRPGFWNISMVPHEFLLGNMPCLLSWEIRVNLGEEGEVGREKDIVVPFGKKVGWAGHRSSIKPSLHDRSVFSWDGVWKFIKICQHHLVLGEDRHNFFQEWEGPRREELSPFWVIVW